MRCQKGLGADAVLREIEKALVQKQMRPLCRAVLQNLLQQRERNQPSGRVVGATEEYRLRFFSSKKDRNLLSRSKFCA